MTDGLNEDLQCGSAATLNFQYALLSLVYPVLFAVQIVSCRGYNPGHDDDNEKFRQGKACFNSRDA